MAKKQPAPTSALSDEPGPVTAQSVDAATVLYADSVIHLGIGPFVSKATLGTQGPATQNFRPNIVL